MQRPLALFALALAAAPAHAQLAPGPTYNLQLFRPAVDANGHFTVNAAQLLGHLDFSIALTGTYAREPLVLRNDAAGFTVRDFITAQLQAALGLYRWVQLGVSLPVHILFGARDPDGRTFGAQMVGDLGLHPKVRLVRSARHGLGLALLTSLYLPTGQADGFLGEGNVSLRPELILDGELGRARRVRLALNAGALVRFARNDFRDPGTGLHRALGTQLTYGLALAGQVVPQRLELVAELYGYADLTGADPDGYHGAPLEWLAGAKVYLASRSYLQLGAGTGIVPDQTGAPAVRAFIGFIFEPRIGDRDGDGVKDDLDRCPDQPEDRDDFEDEDGCPDPDNDRDQILDIDDKCPNQPETRNGFEDEDGCPDAFDPDRDDDGIPDRIDHCPDEPEDQDGFEDADGCPDPDNDGDRILDVDDLCPNDPEDYDGFEDADGCPDRGIVRRRRGHLEVLKAIHFETARATIKPESYPILDAVAATLAGNPEVQRLEIQGHADERGDDAFNLRLTEDRAQAVKQYLIGRGIVGARLDAHGYGEERPLCRAHNEACWSRNRRVEFVIVQQSR
jgi:outer membrane protein OmpA-like peptidoglycan-associated protein